MKIIDCPVIGPRPAAEFTYGGAIGAPPVEDPTPDQLAEHVFYRAGAPGVLREWWYHRPTGRWFVLERNTATNDVLRTVEPEEVAYAIPML